jgi:hypothetical protein
MFKELPKGKTTKTEIEIENGKAYIFMDKHQCPKEFFAENLKYELQHITEYLKHNKKESTK